MRCRLSSRPGFTLLEVLVASVIVALLAAGLAVSLNVAFRARRSVTEALESVRLAQVAMNRMAQDLQSALPPTGTLAYEFATSSTTSADGGSDGLTFFNLSDPLRGRDGAGDVEQVEYALVDEASLQMATPGTVQMLNGVTTSNSIQSVVPPAAAAAANTRVLVRRVMRNLLASVQETPVDQVLCRNVQSFSIQVYSSTLWTNTWDSSTQGNALPAAVQITLQVAPPEEGGNPRAQPYTLMRIVRLPCGDAVASTSTASVSTPVNTP